MHHTDQFRWRHSHTYALDSSAAERRSFIASTPILGAILLTVIVPEPLQVTFRAGAGSFEILFPVIFAVVMWGWLFLRDPRLCELIPVRRMS
jgi:hypothetical protein